MDRVIFLFVSVDLDCDGRCVVDCDVCEGGVQVVSDVQ